MSSFYMTDQTEYNVWQACSGIHTVLRMQIITLSISGSLQAST